MCLDSVELFNKKPRGFWEKSCNNPRYNHKLEVITAWKWLKKKRIHKLEQDPTWKVAGSLYAPLGNGLAGLTADCGFHVFLDRLEALKSSWSGKGFKLCKVEVCQLIARGYGDGFFPRLRVSTFAYMRLAKKKKGKKS
jgi:hypothetical protein